MWMYDNIYDANVFMKTVLTPLQLPPTPSILLQTKPNHSQSRDFMMRYIYVIHVINIGLIMCIIYIDDKIMMINSLIDMVSYMTGHPHSTMSFS